MGFLDGLRRGWISIRVPGTVPLSEARTYVRYRADQIPAVPGYLGSWEWLRASSVHPDSTLGQAQQGVARDLTPQALAELPISNPLPSDFAGFASDIFTAWMPESARTVSKDAMNCPARSRKDGSISG